jgi:hypothetical protein
MNTRSRFVLFSIERPNNKNDSYKPDTGLRLSKYGFKQVIGSYNGQTEDSYMVLANEDDALNEVIAIAKEFNQESILVVDENRIATLQFLTSPANATILGSWTPIEALEAQSLENWTLDQTNYYTVK